MEIKLRPAKITDSNRILQLERELFGLGAWTPGMLAEELVGYGRWYIVAESTTMPDEIVGYAGIWALDDVSQIMTIGIDPIMHRKGIGRILLQALIDQSIIMGAKELFLEVQVDNIPALGLYNAFGFETLGIRKRYYEDKDAYTMRLLLR